MAGSRKSSRNGSWSASFAEEKTRAVQSQPNSPLRTNRPVNIQEHYNGHNVGLGSRTDEPHSEDEGSVSSHSSLPECLRPRIRKDLLPHDFMKWTTSGIASPSSEIVHSSHLSDDLPASSGLPVFASKVTSGYGEANNGADQNFFLPIEISGEANGARAGEIQNNRQLESSCLSDWIQQFKGWDREGGQRPSSLKEMEMQGSVSTIDKDLYQNLVEMIPLMESFMDQRGNQRKSFAHHASLVYTPAPPRDGLSKKESPVKVKNKQQRAAKPHDAMCCNEQENVLSRIETTNVQQASEQSYEDWSSNRHTLELQNQIEEMKQKLVEKDELLQALQRYEDAHDAVTKTNEQLQNKIEELQEELRQKEYLTQSAQLKLSEQQHEIKGLSTFLERLQGDVLQKNDKVFQMEEEMAELRCQVTALRYQLEAVDLNSDNTQGVEFDLDEHQRSFSDCPKSNHSSSVELPMQGNGKQNYEKLLEEFSGMELARRMYLAAVVAAREKPGDEALTLAAELRKQLQTFLIQAPLLSKMVGDSLTSQTFGIQLM